MPTRPLIRFSFIICNFAFLLPACVGGRAPETPTGPHVRVLTYNINYGAPRPDLALAAIRDSGADIVCLQETTPAWQGWLTPRLTDLYPHSLFRHSRGAGGQGIFSKAAVTESAWIPAPSGWFPGWILRAETPIGPLQILALHLHPAVTDEGRFSVGAYFSTGDVRLNEIRTYHTRLAQGVPTVVVGDLNEGDSGGAVAWLVAQNYTDALPEFEGAGDTWEWPWGPFTIAKRLDHILYSHDLRCLEAKVLREGASDHFPVLGVLE